MRRILLALASALVPITCIAGGTVEFEQIDHLLQQTPQIRAALLQSFDLPGSAYAEIRLGPHFKHLSAYRLGPYTFQAHAKGNTGSRAILVTVCTTYQFLDRSGKVLPQGTDVEFDAVQVQERVTGVVLSESADITASSCRQGNGS
jgi:hypothetical protein